MLVNPVVQQILAQINSMGNAKEIKKLLLLKLESELVDERCKYDIPREPYVASSDEVIILG